MPIRVPLRVHPWISIKYFPTNIFPYCVTSYSICLAPGAVINKFTPSNPDYTEHLIRVMQRISKGNIRACTMAEQDHLLKVVCLANSIGICQERIQTVMAIPIGAPATTWLKAHRLASIINQAGNRSQIVVTPWTAVKYQQWCS